MRVAAIVVLSAATCFAQRGFTTNNNSNASNGNRGSNQGGQHNGTQHNSGQHNGGQQQLRWTGRRELQSGSTPTYVSPFNQQVHLQSPGAGCYGCGYAVYGGYAYGGYYGSANPDGYPTATDQILANGGTFNNASQQQSAPQQYTQAPPPVSEIYIRPEYPVQYSSSPSANGESQPVAQMASAGSDSPAILVFKDGTNMTIKNYAIYGTNIVVLTPERKKFPIAALDIPATQKANDAAGYELHLPAVFTSR